jgi:hypothetical protein
VKPSVALMYEFVEYIPSELKEGTIYVSTPFATAVHKCCCGCGNEVVTPLSPTDWKLVFDGVSISLDPSIGNWGFDCRSHYWISRNRAIWMPRWSREEIDIGRFHDQSNMKERCLETAGTMTESMRRENSGRPGKGKSQWGLWRKLKIWWLQWYES